MKPTQPIKMALWLMVAATAFFVMAASSPQCARSADQSFQPGFQPLAGPDPVAACQRDCKAAARKATHDERRRHRLQLKACNGDTACADAENALHDSIVAEIAADETACELDCQHQQGAATGGQ